jgi:hypothetical protein
VFLEPAVGAELSAVAGVVVAFGGHHAVEASFSAVIGDVGVFYAAVFFTHGSAETGLHLIVLGDFAFTVKVDVFLDGREVFEALAEVVQPCLVVLEHADHLN